MIDNFGKRYTVITLLNLIYIGLVSEILSFVLQKGKRSSASISGWSFLQITILLTCTGSSVVVGEEVFQGCFCLLRYLAANNLSVIFNLSITVVHL